MNKVFKYILVLILVLGICSCSNTMKGYITYEGNAIDDELNITCDSAILVRKVEMVQYNKNENGEVELVLANYPIESFDTFINPEFPANVTNKIFHSTIKMNNAELTDEQIACLVYNNQNDLVKLNDLTENNGNIYGLVLNNESYISASNDWKLGEIRVTYYKLNLSETKEYIIAKSNSSMTNL